MKQYRFSGGRAVDVLGFADYKVLGLCYADKKVRLSAVNHR
jgi:hypothetical protein